MGGSPSSQPSTTTTTQTSEPWKEQKPFLIEGFKAARGDFRGSTPEYFPGSTVVPYAPETEAALGIKTAQATDPNSLISRAQAETGKTLGGDYLSPDSPVFKGMLEGVTRQVRPGVDSTFESSGRSGTSPLHSEALARGVSSGMLPFIQSERDRQYRSSLDAATTSQFSPTLLGQVGKAREAFSKDQLQEDIDRHNFEQTKEQQKIQQFMGNLSGNYGGTQTGSATKPLYSGSGVSSGLGQAATGVGITNALFGQSGLIPAK